MFCRRKSKSIESYKYYAANYITMNENDIIITPKVDSIGRVMIPKHVRDAIGLEPGDLAEIAVRRKQHKKEDAPATTSA